MEVTVCDPEHDLYLRLPQGSTAQVAILQAGCPSARWSSPTVPGASVEANDAVFEVFQERLFRSNLRPRN